MYEISQIFFVNTFIQLMINLKSNSTDKYVKRSMSPDLNPWP